MKREFLAILIGILVTIAVLAGVGYTLAHRRVAEDANQTLSLAENLAEDGKWALVVQTLTPFAERRLPAEQRERVTLLQARAHQSMGNREQADTYWNLLAEGASDPELRGRALFEMATASVLSAEDTVKAQELIGRLRALNSPPLNDRIQYLNALVRVAEGDKIGARDALREAWRSNPSAPVRELIETRLGRINMDLLFDRQPHGDDELYTIERGDTLDRLGREFSVSPSLVERVNGVNPRNLTIGRRIKIPRHDFRIEVYKSEFQVYLFDGDHFFQRYPCRVGRVEYMTPEETFHIESKTKDPDWTDPASGRRYEAGDPGNELGTRWMGFRENPSLGIHGTIHPETIGTPASSGCVGLMTEDVEVLFDLVPRGTEVAIYKSKADADAQRRPASAPSTPAAATPETAEAMAADTETAAAAR